MFRCTTKTVSADSQQHSHRKSDILETQGIKIIFGIGFYKQNTQNFPVEAFYVEWETKFNFMYVSTHPEDK